MKRKQGLLMGCLALMVTGLVQAGESHHVVKIKSWDKDVAYEVMSDTEFRQALADQQKQAKYASKAADLAKAAWQSDESTRGKPFPQKALALPLYTKAGTFSNKEQADEKYARYLDKEREQKGAKRKSGGKGKPKGDPREAEAQARLRAARTIFEAKLSELTAQEANPVGDK